MGEPPSLLLGGGPYLITEMTETSDPLRALLAAASSLSPDRLAGAIQSVAEAFGATHLTILLSDYSQQSLIPLPGSTRTEAIDVDDTDAGRAFMTGEAVVGSTDGTTAMWVPIVNGTERIGVLEARLPHGGEHIGEELAFLSAISAQLLITKGQYTDLFARTRRRRALSLAAEMQWDALPPTSYSAGSLVVAALLEPAYDIGGDSFDYAHNGERFEFVLVDAMGHGLDAVMVSLAAVGSLRHSRREGSDLPQAYAAAGEAVHSEFGHDLFVTAQIGDLDLTTGRLRWLNAGHPRPLLLRDGTVVGQLECEPSLPIGLDGTQPTVIETWLHPGDRVLFFTDGTVEARGEHIDAMHVDRLATLFAMSVAEGHIAAETVRRLSLAVQAAHRGRLSDDATMMLIEWSGSRHAPDGS